MKVNLKMIYMKEKERNFLMTVAGMKGNFMKVIDMEME